MFGAEIKRQIRRDGDKGGRMRYKERGRDIVT